MTPGCYICDPASFHSDEEPCDECFRSWLDYVEALLGARRWPTDE